MAIFEYVWNVKYWNKLKLINAIFTNNLKSEYWLSTSIKYCDVKNVIIKLVLLWNHWLLAIDKIWH